MDIREKLQKDLLFFDGAMGTMVQKAGLKAGQQPELYNITHPNIIRKIHRAYIEAGSDIVTTNTFGANEYKLKGTGYSSEEIVKAGVAIARKEAGKTSWVALDIGPIGQLMAPNGTLSFEDVYRVVAKQVKAGESAGADLVIIETLGDLYEMKAAILAIKENSSLPIFCTLTYDQSGRTLMGTDPLTAINVLEGLGVDALGANCSLGPKELMPIVDEILNFASKPVIVQPNAGLPELIDGETVFPMTPKEFTKYGLEMIERGVRIIGGCCGSGPEFISGLKRAIEEPFKAFQNTMPQRLSAVSSSSNTVIMGEGTIVVGERINPNSNKAIVEALKNRDFDELVSEAIEQKMDGADILDINVSVPGVDEIALMTEAILEIQTMVNTPLQISSTSPQVIEKAARLYNGKTIINGVVGTKSSMEAIFPVVKKYGACVVGLTSDGMGVPENVEDRLKLAKFIVDTAIEYGIPKENIIINSMASIYDTNEHEFTKALRATDMIKSELGVLTIQKSIGDEGEILSIIE